MPDKAPLSLDTSDLVAFSYQVNCQIPPEQTGRTGNADHLFMALKD